MAFLIMFRHGKSDWEAEYSTDRERPLAKRGRRAAETMGRLLADARRVPDRAVTSPALRARHTLELATEAGRWERPIDVEPLLYAATTDLVLEVIRREPTSTTSLLLCGHDPTWSKVTSLLIGGGDVRLPTGAMAGVSFADLSWDQIGPGAGQLRWLLIPRLFAGR